MEKIGLWQIKRFGQVSSTNDQAKKLVAKLNEQCIVTALSQTNGRGRRGRCWISQTGNLFASFAFEIELFELSKMVILSAVSVFEVIKSVVGNKNVKIKWPNDILVDGKKISGILFEKAHDNFWIMGVGINVQITPLNVDSNYDAVCLKDLHCGISLDEVFEKLVSEFDKQLEKYRKSGFDEIRQTWLDNAFNLGNPITIRQENKNTDGIFCGIGDNGELLLKTAEKTEKILVGDLLVKEVL